MWACLADMINKNRQSITLEKFVCVCIDKSVWEPLYCSIHSTFILLWFRCLVGIVCTRRELTFLFLFHFVRRQFPEKEGTWMATKLFTKLSIATSPGTTEINSRAILRENNWDIFAGRRNHLLWYYDKSIRTHHKHDQQFQELEIHVSIFRYFQREKERRRRRRERARVTRNDVDILGSIVLEFELNMPWWHSNSHHRYVQTIRRL